MKLRTFKMWRTVIVFIVAIIVGWSVAQGNALVPVPTVIASVIILLLFKRGVKEVIIDERIFSIANKAAMLAFRIFAIIAATVGGTLIAMSRETAPGLDQAGFTLAYSSAAMVLIYYIGYFYYSKKLGGRE